MTFIAALCLLVTLSAACQRRLAEGQADNAEAESGEAESNDSTRELSFEEQYDLGMRLLSEGNYEEAIIAFSAALEINPKSVDVYHALADIYEAKEDERSMRRILEQGIEATGDERLKSRLSNLPLHVPQVPEIIWEGNSIYYTRETYVTVDEELEAIVAEAIEAGLTGNIDILQDVAWNTQLAERVCIYLKESGIEQVNHVYESDEAVVYQFWTRLSDGNLLRYYYDERIDAERRCVIVYRAEDGNGFGSRLRDNWESDYVTYRLIRGEMSGWLFNGPFTGYDYSYYGADEGEGTTQTTGTAVDELFEGEQVATGHTVRLDTGEESDWMTYFYYKDGKLQDFWSDDEGEKYPIKIVDETGVSYSHGGPEAGKHIRRVWEG